MVGKKKPTFKWKQPPLQMESNNPLPRGWLLLGYETWTGMKLHFTDLEARGKKKKETKKIRTPPAVQAQNLFAYLQVIPCWKKKQPENES